MNTSEQVSKLIAEWTQQGLTKAEIVIRTAESCMGWSYVWGGYGQICNVTNRKSYADRSSCPAGESEVIRKKCQRLNGTSSSCNNCKWYPGGTTRFFDCRGFTRWCLQQVGISLKGAGATSQWKDNSNWTQKGSISDIPSDKVCCVFMADGSTMKHTGLYIGNGIIIHCSGEVKKGKVTDKGWTHYAIPVGIDGTAPIALPTIRRGDSGVYVTLAQTKLIQQGYPCGSYGADGKFGAATETAVKNFQRDHVDSDGKPLGVDGIVGQKTWAALDATIPATKYTVTIPHLSKSQADALKAQYPEAVISKEGG